MPTISIIMAAYNAERFIGDAIDSIRNQTCVDWELIIVNDGSDDATSAIANKAAKRDCRIRLLNQENSGKPAIARNRGLELASGEFLCFLDADDYYEPERLECLLAVFNEHPAIGMAFHDAFLEDDSNVRKATTYLRNAGFHTMADKFVVEIRNSVWHLSERFFVFMALHYAGVHTVTVMIRRAISKAARLRFSEDLTIGEDTELWVRIAEVTSVAYLDRILSTYRMHGLGITASRCKHLEGTLAVHKKTMSRIRPKLSAEELRCYLYKIAMCQADLAYYYLCNGESRKARHLYWESCRINWAGYAGWAGLVKSCLPWERLKLLVTLFGRAN